MTEQKTGENQEPETESLGEGGKKALDAERRARRDAEKALREAQERIAELERADVVREVASAKGLDPKLATRLKGSSREELEADADEFLAMVTPEERTGKVSGLPKEKLRGGNDPTVDTSDDPAALAEKIVSS
jgi:regulator of protease activity HflC (stomatin/prohibitin superfamily)